MGDEIKQSGNKDSAENSKKLKTSETSHIPGPSGNERANSTSPTKQSSGQTKSSSYSIIVNSRQKGNPILRLLKNVSWEYGDTVADYEMGRCNCTLYLSVKYHSLHPDYIYQRVDNLGKTYDLRVLLVSVDVEDSSHSIGQLAQMCVMADMTLVLTFSLDEAARYLEAYKIYEHKPPDILMERGEVGYVAQAVDFITSVKGVNKRDAQTLLTAFGSVAGVLRASVEEMRLCTGFGYQKATRLHSTVNENFLKN